MNEASLFEQAARYLPGVLFVLRKGHGERHHLLRADGRLEPFAIGAASSPQAAFERLFSDMSDARRCLLLRALRRLWRLRGEIRCRFEIETEAGKRRLELRAQLVKMTSGVFMTGFLQDRTELEEALAGKELGATLEAAVRLFPDMVWLKDTQGHYVLCNEMFERFNGRPNAALIGKSSVAISDGQLANIHIETDRQAFASNEIVAFEHELDGDPANRRFFDVRKLALRNASGKPSGILGTAREMSQWRKMENEIRQSELAYRSLFENIPDRLIRFGQGGTFQEMNRAMRQFFEVVAYPLPGEIVDEANYPAENIAAAAELFETQKRVLAGGEAASREFHFIDHDGVSLFHEVRFVPEFATEGEVVSVLGIGRDITDRRKMEQKLAEKEAELHALAFRDGLTGLHNRRSFQERLEGVLGGAPDPAALCALLLLDIDRFKYVNDTLGHVAGDELIRQFAARLTSVVGARGHVCRLGGDEFAIILPDLASPDGAAEIAGEVHRTFETPISLDRNTIAITTSIGLAFGNLDTADQDELFRFADMALYAAKAAGRARTKIYDSGMARQASERFELEALIGEGMRNDEFVTYFQTKTDLATGATVGVEALCRWLRPDGRTILPSEFIPVAEETGQIIEIGRRVLRDACAFAVQANMADGETICVSVNVSARQILFGGFLGTLGACLEETGCNSCWIELELTESVLLGEDSLISETLDAIVQLGVRLTVDDFGIGYSSLSYLARFPITTLKIDRSFVCDLDRNPRSDVLCRAIISMAQGLGLKTVAEGIETAEIAVRLKHLGCDMGQGYLWGRPAAASAVLGLIETGRTMPRIQSTGR